MVLAIFVAVEAVVRVVTARPNLVTRNVGTDDQNLQYLLEQLHRSKRLGTPRIVFIGSSVMQGYLNAWDDRAFPFMAQQMLRKKLRLQGPQGV
ncbi:MAG: hypothetical protein M5R36_04940 [Deltaproteobacteria bacterium]|nr:hypothetical protein [Deltaproteobacteria bacterium]